MVKIDMPLTDGYASHKSELKGNLPNRKKSGLTVHQMQAQGNLHFFKSSTKRAELFSGPIISSPA